MRVKYKGGSKYCERALISEKEYDMISAERGWFRIMTELEEDYLFPQELFEITED